jgi:hypothetical protein
MDIEQEHNSKHKERQLMYRHALNRCLNNEDGRIVLEYLGEIFNTPTDFTNPSRNYFRDGQLDVIRKIRLELKFINEKTNDNA